jgi:lipoprotein LprG
MAQPHLHGERLLSTLIESTKHLRAVPALLAAGCLALTAAACGSSAPTKVDPSALLHQAKLTLDGSSGAHFHLTSTNVSKDGTNLVGGDGDLTRPDSLQGGFSVTISGFTANVKVASVGGVFEAELPFTAHYVKTNPANFGLTDPAQLLDSKKGLTNVLALAQNPKSTGSIRVNGELLDTVSFTLPGTDLPVLPDANPSKPVDVVAAVNPKNHQLRQITVSGPLTSATMTSTFVVTLTNYNEHVTITLPPAS